jgi:metacaspase-1
MKRSIVLLLAILWTIQPLRSQGRKIALLVGVGEYTSAEYSSKPLNAAKGVQLMRATLLGQGFLDRDLLVLADADATREGIQNAFETHLLQAEQGDRTVFYFYGHGTQIQDDNKEEADLLDEALVPHDGQRSSEKNHHNLIRDDDLGKWIKSLRGQTGPEGQVLVLLDACHSGSGLRGTAAANVKQDQHKIAFENEEKGLAPFVALYSSMPHQPSIEMTVEENERCALLTWAFCKAMRKMEPSTTYRGLFEQTALHMATRSRKQTPQMEGEQDMLIFGGKVPPPVPYFRVVTALGPQAFLLAGGLMHGLHAGALVSVYPPEIRDTTGVSPLAIGEVMETGLGLLESTVALDRAIPEDQLASAWVFVTQRRFNGYTLSLRLDVADEATADVIRGRLADMSALSLENSETAELTLSLDKGKLTLWSADGIELWQERYVRNNPDPLFESLRVALGNYLQAQFLRGLEFDGSSFHTDFRAQVGASEPSFGRAGLSLRVQKDTAFLQVVNRSSKPIYYTILDIDARNVVKVLLPGPGWLPADFRLEPGAESPLHAVLFNAPGREVLKLIATPVPIDLRETVASRGRSRKGRSFFENLFGETYLEDGKRRGPSGKYRGGEAGVETVVIEVVR